MTNETKRILEEQAKAAQAAAANATAEACAKLEAANKVANERLQGEK